MTENGRGGANALTDDVVREDLSAQGTCHKKWEWDEEMRAVDIWGKGVQTKGRASAKTLQPDHVSLLKEQHRAQWGLRLGKEPKGKNKWNLRR